MNEIKSTEDAILLLSKRIVSVENSIKMQNEQIGVLISGMNSLISLQKENKIAPSVVQSPAENDTLPSITNSNQMTAFEVKEYVSTVRRKLHNRLNEQNKILQTYIQAHSTKLANMNACVIDLVKCTDYLEGTNKKLIKEYSRLINRYNLLAKRILDITDNISKARSESFSRYIPKNLMQATIDKSFMELRNILLSEKELSEEIGRIQKILKGPKKNQYQLFIPNKKDLAAVKLVMDLWFAFQKLNRRKRGKVLALLAVSKREDKHLPLDNITLEVYEDDALIHFRKIPKSGFCTVWINSNQSIRHRFVVRHKGEIISESSALNVKMDETIITNIYRIPSGGTTNGNRRIITKNHIELAKMPLKKLKNLLLTYKEEPEAREQNETQED